MGNKNEIQDAVIVWNRRLENLMHILRFFLNEVLLKRQENKWLIDSEKKTSLHTTLVKVVVNWDILKKNAEWFQGRFENYTFGQNP